MQAFLDSVTKLVQATVLGAVSKRVVSLADAIEVESEKKVTKDKVIELWNNMSPEEAKVSVDAVVAPAAPKAARVATDKNIKCDHLKKGNEFCGKASVVGETKCNVHLKAAAAKENGKATPAPKPAAAPKPVAAPKPAAKPAPKVTTVPSVAVVSSLPDDAALEAMTVIKLRELVKDQKITGVTSKSRKADIIACIVAARGTTKSPPKPSPKTPPPVTDDNEDTAEEEEVAEEEEEVNENE